MAESKLSFKDKIRMVFKDVNDSGPHEALSSGESPDLPTSEESEAVGTEPAEPSNELEEQGCLPDITTDSAISRLKYLQLTDSNKQIASDSSSDSEDLKRECEFLKRDEFPALPDIVQFPRTAPVWNTVFKEILNNKVPSDVPSQEPDVSPQVLIENCTEQRGRASGGAYRKSRGRSYNQTQVRQGGKAYHDGSKDNGNYRYNYDNEFKRRRRGSRQQQMDRAYDCSHEDNEEKKRPRGARQQQRNKDCHCCKANRQHLERLRNTNRYEEFSLNDFDGAGVDCFKNSDLAPDLLPYKTIEGNRVYYHATPKHRYLEGFIADFLKPENRKPVELTEEQKAALEPDEYWDV